MQKLLPRATVADRALLAALVFSWVIHGIALLAMVTVLDPGVNMQTGVADRARYVAENAGRWKLGWLMWQLTALSDFLVSATLLAAAWRFATARKWAWFGLAATVLAILPDQYGEFRMVTAQVEKAAAASGGAPALAAYLEIEAMNLFLTGTLGCMGYAWMSVGWLKATVAMAEEAHGAERAGSLDAVRAPGLEPLARWDALCAWTGAHAARFRFVGLLLCGVFMVCAVTNCYSALNASVAEGYPKFAVTFALNALGFPLLMAWMAWMTPLAASVARWSEPASAQPAAAAA